MIYTLTLAPSLDYVMECENIQIGAINRSRSEDYYPGGKGINVSIVLKNLGMESIAIGFLGGFTGDYIMASLDNMHIKHRFVKVNGNSRINVKIKGNIETAINGIGPRVSADYYGDLLLILNGLKEDDFLILSGSVIKDFSDDIYEKIMIFLKNRGVRIIVDTYGAALSACLRAKPFLVKPNLLELEDLFQVKLDSLTKVEQYGKKLIDLGAENAIVSLGDEGAIYVDKSKEVTFLEAFSGTVKNTVGAGDAMVAGFVYNFSQSNSFQEAFKFSMACGGAAAFSNSMPSKEDIFSLIK